MSPSYGALETQARRYIAADRVRMREVTNELDNGWPHFSSKGIFTLKIGI